MGTFGIIALVLSALGMLGSGISNYINTRKTNEANKQQYEDWKSYNTPAAQMQRLGDAGLNPYMISGVNNTLSQPFQYGQNSGIAEALEGLSQSTQSGIGQYTSSAIKRDSNAIRRDQLEVTRDKLEFEKSFGDLKKKMMNNAIKRGDAQTAMFWSSVNQKDIVTNYLKRTMPFRVGKSYYDYLTAQQGYSFNELMNPLKLDFYAPVQRAKINKAYADISHLAFMENYMRDKFLFNRYTDARDYEFNKFRFNVSREDKYDMFNKRLDLSNQYYDLAYKKWLTNTLFQGLNFFKGGKLNGYSGWNSSISY